MPLNLGAFLGGNNGQGGLMPQIQAAQKAAQARDLQAAAWQAMQAGLIPPNQGGAPPVPNQTSMPPQLPNTSGMPPAPGNGAPPVPAPQAPPQGSTDPIVRQTLNGGASPPPAPAAAPQSSQGTPNIPPDKLQQLMVGIAGLKIPDWQKGAVFEKMGAFITPYEKMQQQLELAQQKLASQQQMLDERMQTMVQIRQMADATSASNTQMRAGATERGQDIRADTAAAGQDIQQQRADTAQASQQSRAKLGEAKQKETEKLDTAKIRKMETATSAENKKPFQAAKSQYERAASLYQSLTRPGATPAASPDDIAFAKQKMDAAADTMTQLAGSGGASSAALIKPTAGEEVRTDGQGNYFVLRDGKPTPAEPPAGQ